MYRNPTLLPRGLLKFQRLHLGPATTTRTWILPRKGVDHARRQFHASPQRANWAESIVIALESASPYPLSVWIVLPALAATPHLLRFFLDHARAAKDEAAVQKVEQLINILPAIENNRIRKLASTAISKKIDQPKLQYTYDQFAKHKNPVTERFYEQHVRNMARYLFLPGTLHFGWTLLALFNLRNQSTFATALAKIEGAGDLVIKLGLDHATIWLVLSALWVGYLRYHPYQDSLTPTTVRYVSPFWGLVTGFRWPIQTNRLYVHPEWLEAIDVTKGVGETSFKDDVNFAFTRLISMSLSLALIWGMNAFQVLYLGGAIGAGLLRWRVSVGTRSDYASAKKKRLQRWMPLEPKYKP